MSDLTSTDYAALLDEVKSRITSARVRAALAASRQLLLLYWDIGQLIDARQEGEGWGARVIPRLAADLAREIPDARGFSERNLKRMVQFFHAYTTLGQMSANAPSIGPQPVAQLGSAETGPQPVAQLLARGDDPQEPPQWGSPTETGAQPVPQSPHGRGSLDECARLSLELPWGHNILLLQKVSEAKARAWYMQRCIAEGWSRDVLGLMIKSRSHERSGATLTNFASTLPPAQSDLAQQVLKNPYVFDFLSLDVGFRERELERGLLVHLERFLIELGVGFAFVGRQVRLTIEEDEFFVDLLFYHLKLRCFVVVELKVGPFKAEYAGKLNLYLNLVDDSLRHPSDAPSIGLILCQDKKRVLAEYALRGMDKPIGVSEYELTRALPAELASTLPTIEAIEAELAGREGDEP